MNLLTVCFLMILTGHSTSAYVQRLHCPYGGRNESQIRIWCKRDAQDENCCTGFTFRPGVSLLEDGRIHVQDDGKSFTVSMLTLTQGDGVYWCGLMANDQTIVKLAEDYFTTSLWFAWSILRWIIFLLLCLVFILIFIHSNKKNEDGQDIYEDIVSGVQQSR